MDLNEIHEWIVRDGEDEEINFDLPKESKNMKTDNIMFLSKRIVEKKNDGSQGSQLAVTQDVLISAYTGKFKENSKGKNYKGEEKEIYIPEENSTGMGEFSIKLLVEDGKLVLKQANMSKELFEAIKSSEGAEENKPYYITVTDGSKENPKTKIARIEFKLIEEEVKANLVK